MEVNKKSIEKLHDLYKKRDYYNKVMARFNDGYECVFGFRSRGSILQYGHIQDEVKLGDEGIKLVKEYLKDKMKSVEDMILFYETNLNKS